LRAYKPPPCRRALKSHRKNLKARAIHKESETMSQSGNIDIDYVAKLARIALTPEEKETFSGQLKQILGYFEKLSQIDVSGVEPSAHANAVYNVWREDVSAEPMSVEKALLNAPAKRDNQIVVPKVVDDA